MWVDWKSFHLIESSKILLRKSESWKTFLKTVRKKVRKYLFENDFIIEKKFFISNEKKSIFIIKILEKNVKKNFPDYSKLNIYHMFKKIIF